MQLAAILLFYKEPGKQEKIMLIHKVRFSLNMLHQTRIKRTLEIQGSFCFLQEIISALNSDVKDELITAEH